MLRLAESSNTMLLLPMEVPQEAHTETIAKQLEAPEECSDATKGSTLKPMTAVAQSMSYFELKKAAPRISHLRALLSSQPWTSATEAEDADATESGPASEEATESADATQSQGVDDGSAKARPSKRARVDDLATRNASRQTYAQIESWVQCSEHELKLALQRSRALEIDGVWATLEPQYERDVISCVLSLMVELEWPLDALPLQECVSRSLEQERLQLKPRRVRVD